MKKLITALLEKQIDKLDQAAGEAYKRGNHERYNKLTKSVGFYQSIYKKLNSYYY